MALDARTVHDVLWRAADAWAAATDAERDAHVNAQEASMLDGTTHPMLRACARAAAREVRSQARARRDMEALARGMPAADLTGAAGFAATSPCPTQNSPRDGLAPGDVRAARAGSAVTAMRKAVRKAVQGDRPGGTGVRHRRARARAGHGSQQRQAPGGFKTPGAADATRRLSGGPRTRPSEAPRASRVTGSSQYPCMVALRACR